MSKVVGIHMSGGGGGDTTVSNVGTGAGLFKEKVGDDLKLKSLTAGTNVTITESADDIQIESTGGGGGSDYADVAIAASNIDWSLGNTYFKEVSANSSFTFSNIVEKQISVILKNTSASNITVGFPVGFLKSGLFNNVIMAGKENIYTFVRSNSKTYMVAVTDMGV